MASETSSPSTSSPHLLSGSSQENELELETDNSFETVAEALRLQWSVIGNSNVTPASPEEVAKIVAEAEKRLKEKDSGMNQVPSDLATASPSSTQHDLSGTHPENLTPQPTKISFPIDDTSLTGSDEQIKMTSDLTSSVEQQGDISAQAATEKTWFLTKDGSYNLHTNEDAYHSRKKLELENPDPLIRPSNDQEQTVPKNPKELEPVLAEGKSSRTDETYLVQSGSTPLHGVLSHLEGSELLRNSPVQHNFQQQTTSVVSHMQQENATTPPIQLSSSSPYSQTSSSLDLTAPETSHLSRQASVTHLQFPPLRTVHVSPAPQIGPLFPKRSSGTSQEIHEFHSGSVDSVGQQQGSQHRQDLTELMREKVRLQGELEVLKQEAQDTLQERAELQAQLASLQLKLKSGHMATDYAEKASLRAELERLRSTRMDHEREALEVQRLLEEKMEELKSVSEDLYQSQDTVDKLQVRMKELRDDLQAKEVTVQALKSKIAELYVEVQTTLQNKMEADSEARTARNDLVVLVKAKEWYQEQLSVAHEVRAKLQQQLTHLQAQTMSQGSIVERLKLESTRLRQQLRESQERALREKEQLARHLETIQNDMMEREAAFQEIQRERLMIEDTFNTQVTTVEEEKSRISSLLQLTSDLEAQLEQAQASSKKKQMQVFSLENEQMELMKKLTLSQDALVEKDQILEELSQKLIEVESQLSAFMKTLAAKDAELHKLREEKASTEIALNSALQEKASVDHALETLKGDMGKVEKSFKQMRQELGIRQVELQKAQAAQKAARDELDRVQHDLDIKNRSVEALTLDHHQKLSLIQQLQAFKTAAEEELAGLKKNLELTRASSATGFSAQEAMQTELQETKARLFEAEARLKTVSIQLQQTSGAVDYTSITVPNERLQSVVTENEELHKQLSVVQQELKDSLEKHQQERETLRQEALILKSRMMDSKTQLQQTVQMYLDQLQQLSEQKERLQTELELTQRKFELCSVQQQGEVRAELQSLMSELESARLQKQGLEHQLAALVTQKDTQIAALQQQLADTQQANEVFAQEQEKHLENTALIQQLTFELEKERGRIAGLQQSNATLKLHMKQLEEALAGRESSLVELNSHLTITTQEQERLQQEYLQRIQELELVLQKEKDAGRELRKQIGSKITENKRLLKLQEQNKKEQGDLLEEAERRHAELLQLQSDLDAARQAVSHHQGEMQTVQTERRAIEVELERIKRELADSKDRTPVLKKQIESLEWQLSQRIQEMKAAREQLVLAEERQAADAESMHRALQDKQEELESLQAEMAAARQEKVTQKSRVSELRSMLKASVQHHKLTKKLNSKKKRDKNAEGDTDEKGTQADLDNGIIIPPLPFDMEVVEKLLQDTAVKPLDSRPLDSLSSCLSSLRAEITGLQKQMDFHTTTIHSSAQSWRNVESEVKGLQEVVRSIANTIMDVNYTSTFTTSSATDTEQVAE
ncbi:golgin subfamily A member 3-like isoform X3 [Pomacea canaliculata]|nr:golgin subfamily A member 3-like isoform X3 [Pomacea canaliculata]